MKRTVNNIFITCKLFCFLLISFQSTAQIITSEDSLLFEKAWKNKLEYYAGNPAEKPKGEEVIQLARTFLGTPYVASTLEGKTEELRVCLKGQDCVTFVEYSLALSITSPTSKNPIEAFTESLEKVRYRNGKLDGYASRLHYYTEWLSDNSKKGFIKNRTQTCGGEYIDERIDFISKHRDSYPALKNDIVYDSILTIENTIAESQNSEKPSDFHYFIPKEKIHEVEDCIKNGDIIALCTSIEGLDISHVGFAFHKNGRLHFMHASLTHKQVEITDKPLYEYLKGIKHNTGIKIAEVLNQ
ncbi:N-acetylmuramoyl-L-alanine amidase-like domain-containing protein [Sediminitomix flava]|uniref:Uncharacterized protein DUF1460 n=1 Tax=Sediminitomix flava TaxID=379075 RepID=A0A315Z834_SEDFL|nr:N-acetylmuramoyl-L-alanine amidase-like domain-containing protein [Sediminitomix flava]PWJ40085.1 uncharacterized protein DUF1460 [Sediminitomix flava]